MDQGYIKEDILEKNIFRMSSFDDQCMTLYEPKAGSFASLETCDSRITQDISLTETGHIIPNKGVGDNWQPTAPASPPMMTQDSIRSDSKCKTRIK